MRTIKGEKTIVKDWMENVDHISMSLLFRGFEPKNGVVDVNEMVMPGKALRHECWWTT